MRQSGAKNPRWSGSAASSVKGFSESHPLRQQTLWASLRSLIILLMREAEYTNFPLLHVTECQISCRHSRSVYRNTPSPSYNTSSLPLTVSLQCVEQPQPEKRKI